MRVITGRFRGRRIETLESKNMRPTTSRVREAIFNILSHGRFLQDGDKRFLDGCSVLDLFCGSGSLTIEALSRGAAKACFVDIEKQHLDVARRNAEHIGMLDECSFIRADSSMPPPARFVANLVFVDPPYMSNLSGTCLKNLLKSGWVAKGSIIILEMGKKENLNLPEGYTELDDRVYGMARIRVIEVN